MTQFTSFVAVEETVITEGGKPRTVAIPVEMPEGVSYEGVFGDQANGRMANMKIAPPATQAFYRGVGQSLGGAAPRQSSDQAAATVPAREVFAEPKTRGDKDERGRRENERDALKAVNANLPQGIGAKLHPSLVSLVTRAVAPGFAPTAEESGYVAGDKVAVQVWLAGASPEVLAQLKQLGFEETGQARVANIRVGRIEISKLKVLAQLTGVRYITPLTN
jgi:Ca-activated chloride channel family protein